MPQPGEP
ncbi:hypothetical protein HaLaN_06552, partial [Haematococcus lacustris]